MNATAALQVWDAWDNSHGYLKDAQEHDEETSKSLLFNAFIFMQVFNEINSRKILDEYNVFAGMQRSPIFIAVLLVTVGLQVVIVQTPLASIFHVTDLNGARPAQHVACLASAAAAAAAVAAAACLRDLLGLRDRLASATARLSSSTDA